MDSIRDGLTNKKLVPNLYCSVKLKLYMWFLICKVTYHKSCWKNCFYFNEQEISARSTFLPPYKRWTPISCWSQHQWAMAEFRKKADAVDGLWPFGEESTNLERQFGRWKTWLRGHFGILGKMKICEGIEMKLSNAI